MLGTPASELHPAMALNAATDQQYHLLNQDGTADDQMDQLQGDHDTAMAEWSMENNDTLLKKCSRVASKMGTDNVCS
ncbi:hypothetical protein MRX96_030529 [Rhipicephalus microplus]